jgi:hypothetical protein
MENEPGGIEPRLDGGGAGQEKAYDGSGGRRVLAMVVALALTVLMGGLAFMLGSWGYDTRLRGTHQARLQRLLQMKPDIDQVVQGLENEGTHMIAAPRGPAAVRKVARERGNGLSEHIVAKGDHWAQTRVFDAGEIVYFIFFDADGVMRDFVCVRG